MENSFSNYIYFEFNVKNVLLNAMLFKKDLLYIYIMYINI